MQIQKSFKSNQPSFYVIPTPIGNLDDITLRALKTLQNSDYLYCEDKRVTQKLLNHFDIKFKLKTYNEFSYETEKDNILNLIKEGNNVSLVSDAGMPGISDPGFKIIKFLKEQNINIVILPGAVAFTVAMVYNTINEKPFVFKGFLAKQQSKYTKEINEILKDYNNNTIIYESPHRIAKTLKNIHKINPKTQILIAREITKIYEEYIQGDVSEIIKYLTNNTLKGEIIVVISVLKQQEQIDYIKQVNKKIQEGMSSKDAIKEVAKTYEISKNDLYNKYLEQKK